MLKLMRASCESCVVEFLSWFLKLDGIESYFSDSRCWMQSVVSSWLTLSFLQSILYFFSYHLMEMKMENEDKVINNKLGAFSFFLIVLPQVYKCMNNIKKKLAFQIMGVFNFHKCYLFRYSWQRIGFVYWKVYCWLRKVVE